MTDLTPYQRQREARRLVKQLRLVTEAMRDLLRQVPLTTAEEVTISTALFRANDALTYLVTVSKRTEVPDADTE